MRVECAWGLLPSLFLASAGKRGKGGVSVENIVSAQNAKVKRLKSLREKKAREAEGQMLVEGEKLILEALQAGLGVSELVVDQERLQSFEGLIRRLGQAGARIYSVPGRILEAICDTRTPQGACAAVSLPAPMEKERMPDLLVALDGVQDPGNVGTIWRTADAAGFGGLLSSRQGADLFSPKVQRAAMGSSFRIPCKTVSGLEEPLFALRQRGFEILVSSLSGTDFYSRPQMGSRLVLVIGNEARGVSEGVMELATQKLKLPMRGGAESLNAAVAAGIMMYELTKSI